MAQRRSRFSKMPQSPARYGRFARHLFGRMVLCRESIGTFREINCSRLAYFHLANDLQCSHGRIAIRELQKGKAHVLIPQGDLSHGNGCFAIEGSRIYLLATAVSA